MRSDALIGIVRLRRRRARITVRSRWLGTMPSMTRDLRAEKRPSSRRQAVLRILAALLAVFWGLAFYGLIDLLAFAQGPEFHATLLLSTGWGLLFLFLVAAPLLTLCIRSPAVSGAALAEVALVGCRGGRCGGCGRLGAAGARRRRAAPHGRGAGRHHPRPPRPGGGMALVGPTRSPRGPRARPVLRLCVVPGPHDRQRRADRRYVGVRPPARAGCAAARAAADLGARSRPPCGVASARLVGGRRGGVVCGGLLARAGARAPR